MTGSDRKVLEGGSLIVLHDGGEFICLMAVARGVFIFVGVVILGGVVIVGGRLWGSLRFLSR